MATLEFEEQDWMTSPDVIVFHSHCPRYGWLSNFYPVELQDAAGRSYGSVEAYFQAHKYTAYPEIMDRFIALTPQQARALGGKRGIKLSPAELTEWEDSKRVLVMLEGLRRKFAHPELARKLEETGHAVLVEKLPRFADKFWSVQKNGGRNVLGQLLMQVRAEVRSGYGYAI